MSLQKALFLTKKHGEFVVGETAIETPGSKEVLVKVLAAALNPVDWKIQHFGFYIQDKPFICGQDGAGIVEAVGAEVTNVAKGDRM